ncbi:hypothetical protein Taro_053748 [Colocasia esculenta]|uniref:Uncharacterized protein n=1 Tax=Colocasia esculenta TaxID=4460 RepID=A0A843XNP3_COLES|nr:hypothetical protein [Colocasia esculenta]
MAVMLRLHHLLPNYSSSPPHFTPSLRPTAAPPSPCRRRAPSALHAAAAPSSLPPLPSPAPLPTDAGVLFRRKLLYLERSLGVDPAAALARNPDLRSAPISSLRAVADVLASMGLPPTPAAAGRVLSMHPQLLTCDPTADLLPVFHFLIGPAGIPAMDVPSAVLRCPRLLVSSVEGQLLPALYFLRRLGFVGPHRITCRTTLLLVSSVEGTLIPKLEYIQNLGFSRKDAVKMVLRSPGLFTFSIEKNFRPKVAFLVEEMGRDLLELKGFPQYFSFSLEGRIKPRHRLLVEHGFECMRLGDMLKVSDGEFNDRLVEMRLRSLEGSRRML